MALPTINATASDAIRKFLVTKHDMRRPPEKAARLLALICELHVTGQPFPTREEAAEATGFTIWGVDTALQVALARRDIVAVTTTIREGTVVQRISVIRDKHYTPSPELLQVYSSALRKTVNGR